MKKQEIINRIARECIHFPGDHPCRPHQLLGALCRCPAYHPRGEKILILQLSCPLTVLRSNALIHRLKEENPDCYIAYLTAYPEFLSPQVDEPVRLSAAVSARLAADCFQQAINLDSDRQACALMNLVTSENKKGFCLRQGQCHPQNDQAQSEYLRQVFPQACSGKLDRIARIFSLAGLEYHRELPRLEVPISKGGNIKSENLLLLPGLLETPFNLPREEFWRETAELLRERDIPANLLGTPATDWLCRRIAQKEPVNYFGPLSPELLISLLGQGRIVLTADRTAAELALALRKPAILISPQPSDAGEFSFYSQRINELSGDISPLQIIQQVEKYFNFNDEILPDLNFSPLHRHRQQNSLVHPQPEIISCPGAVPV